MFSNVYSRFPMFTTVHSCMLSYFDTCLLVFTSVYTCLPMSICFPLLIVFTYAFTYACHCLLVHVDLFTRVYIYLHLVTYVYPSLLVLTYVYLCLPIFTFFTRACLTMFTRLLVFSYVCCVAYDCYCSLVHVYL